MSLNNNPTHYQLLKRTREQLRASLERESASDELIAALQLQLSDRDRHIGSIQHIIEVLQLALAEKEALVAELEARAAFLEQANNSLYEKQQQQDTIIANIQREMTADKKQLAKQAENADTGGRAYCMVKCVIHARRKFIQCKGTPDFKLAFHVLKYFIAPIMRMNERVCKKALTMIKSTSAGNVFPFRY